jgi:hypothetical protein
VTKKGKKVTAAVLFGCCRSWRHAPLRARRVPGSSDAWLTQDRPCTLPALQLLAAHVVHYAGAAFKLLPQQRSSPKRIRCASAELEYAEEAGNFEVRRVRPAPGAGERGRHAALCAARPQSLPWLPSS